MKTIRGKIFLILGIVFIVSVLGMLVNIRNVSSVKNSSETLENVTFTMYQDATTVQISIEQMQQYMYAYCTTDDAEKQSDIKTLFDTAESNLYTALNDFAELGGVNDFPEDSEQAQNWNVLVTAIDAYCAYFDEITSLVDDGNEAFAKELLWSDISENQVTLLTNMEGMRTQNAGEISTALSSQVKISNIAANFSIITIILLVIAGIVSLIITTLLIVRPIKNADLKLATIISDIENGQGDLTQRIPVETKDEIGQLVKGFNKFMDTLQNIMQQIISHSGNLENSVELVVGQVANANDNAYNTSSTMEQLAASMQEISATVDSVNADAGNVGDETSKISESAEEGASYAQEMKTRATDMKNLAMKNKATTDNMMHEMNEVLRSSIENSKKVEKINELTSDILEISSQTNLLALNASIEAARAGEAGKGFAVVADEIRVLAENSRNTANNIQDISTMVGDAVSELVDNADKILNYINDNILKDYDTMVEMGNQYSEDATSILDMMSNFSSSTEQLQDTMNGIVHAFNDISTAVEESARDVGNVSENTGILVNSMEEIKHEMDNSEEIANGLKSEADKFTNV
ncbi:MAG: methyl-accepting chemotaxis protein [Eubacterium sp.]|nr:methyl-accepting chemotaxis protein [Eubacterium sp.]